MKPSIPAVIVLVVLCACSGRAEPPPESMDVLLRHAAALNEHADARALRQDPETFLRQVKGDLTAARHYDAEALLTMLYGLSVKGSGGGGGLLDGFDIWLELDLERGVDIHDLASVDDDKLYMVVGGLGAPSALKENLDGLVNAIEKAMNKLAELEGKDVGGVLSVESGPVNSMLAILLSQRLGVPLVDVDGAGRSVPSLTNLAYAYQDYPVAPVVAASALDPTQDVIVSYPGDAAQAEEELREAATKLGGLIGIALWGQTGTDLKASSVIREPFFDAWLLGLYVVAGFEDPSFVNNFFALTGDLIAAYDGKLTRFHIDSSGGFDKVYLDLSLADGRSFTINAVNEDLLMQQNTPVPGVSVTAPHIIAYLVQPVGASAWLPFNNGDTQVLSEAAAAQQPLYVLAAQANAELYNFEDSFLQILQQVYGYGGGVVPPYRPHEEAD